MPCLWGVLAALSSPAWAGEVSWLYQPNGAVEYEGTGYREHVQGWELKVKPQGAAGALRWRTPLGRTTEIQVLYLRNKPYYSWEDGNAGSPDRQTGATRFAVQTLQADLRRPFAGSASGMSFGVIGVRETFDREQILNGGVLSPETASERITAAGAQVGVYGGTPTAAPGRFYWDGDFSIAHFFHTRNRLRTEGATLRRWGEGYTLRLETGIRWPLWRLGLGYLRQELSLKVPGGQTLPNGAAVSFPVNKTNFQGTFLAVTYVY